MKTKIMDKVILVCLIVMAGMLISGCGSVNQASNMGTVVPNETVTTAQANPNLTDANVIPITINPSSASAGWTGNITVAGTGTNFHTGSGPWTTTASFNDSAITINSMTATSPNALIMNVTVAPQTVLGIKTLTVTYRTGLWAVATNVTAKLTVHK